MSELEEGEGRLARLREAANSQGGSCTTDRCSVRVRSTDRPSRGDGEDIAGRIEGDTCGKLRTFWLDKFCLTPAGTHRQAGISDS